MDALLFSSNSDENAMLRLALQRAGFSVRISVDFEDITLGWRENTTDLMVFAFPKNELPLSALKQLRALTPIPFIVITEYKNEDAYIALLDGGIDLVYSALTVCGFSLHKYVLFYEECVVYLSLACLFCRRVILC